MGLKGWGPENGPPSGQTVNCRKTKVIQSYLRIWGTFDPIESDPSDPKKWGLYGCSVKNEDFRTENGPWRPPRRPPYNRFNTKILPFWCPVMIVTKNMDDVTKKWIMSQKKALLNSNHVPATTGQCCPKEKVPFYQIINGE